MLSIRLTLSAEWRIWPIVSACGCENSTGKRISLPFMNLWITREKVTA